MSHSFEPEKSFNNRKAVMLGSYYQQNDILAKQNGIIAYVNNVNQAIRKRTVVVFLLSLCLLSRYVRMFILIT